jgi:hypothetical protein
MRSSCSHALVILAAVFGLRTAAAVGFAVDVAGAVTKIAILAVIRRT